MKSKNLALVSASALLLVDLDTRNVIPLDTENSEGYGVSWFPGGRNLVLAHSAVDSARLVDLKSYVESELGYISHGQEKSGPFLSQPHQILCASDGRIVCANTGRNTISVIDLKRPGHFQEARISASRWDRLSTTEHPGDHLNSVFEKDGFLYVIAHGFNKGSQLAKFTYPSLELVDVTPIKNRTGLHNIWITADGRQVSCHSDAGALVDVGEGRVLWESGSLCYLRGLAASADYIVVGEGRKAPREIRRNSMSGIWVVDRKTWQTLDYVPLGWYGAVKEVRLLSVPDEAHHGHVFAGIEELPALDAHAKIRTDRLNAAHRASRSRKAWQRFRPVCGIPSAGEDGGLTADLEDLCLMVEPSSPQGASWRMSIGYRIESDAPHSHVSIVTYRGYGADTDMHALLISAYARDRARLQLWVHDGNEWSAKNDAICVDGLPLAGEIHIAPSLGGLECSINGEPVAKIPKELFPWESGAAGIRWLGATIYPAK